MPPASVASSTPASGARLRFAQLCAVFWLLLASLSLLRHHTFHSSLYDVGIFHQVLWNTARDLPFASSIKHMNYLGDHFSPSFGLLAPLEWLPFPIELLLCAQAAAAVLTAWSIYLLSCRHLNERTALLIGVGTLFCPALCLPTLSDLHPEPFMAAALARGLYDLDRGRTALAGFWMALVLGGKEDAGLLLAPLGLVLAAERRHRVFGLVLGLAALSWTGLALAVFMPHFRPAPVPGAAWFYLGRYAHLGGSAGEIARALVFHPLTSLIKSITLHKVVTFVFIIGAWAAAPLRGGWRSAAALPLAGAHFLSTRWAQFHFGFHYLVPLVPVLAWAAIAGAPRTILRRPRLATAAVAVVALIAVEQLITSHQLTPRPQHAALRQAISVVPPGAPVCVQNWFGAHLSARPFIEFCSLWELERAQYRYFGWPDYSSAEWQIFDLGGPPDEFPGLAERLSDLRAAGAEVVMERDRVTVLRASPAVLQRAAARSKPLKE